MHSASTGEFSSFYVFDNKNSELNADLIRDFQEGTLVESAQAYLAGLIADTLIRNIGEELLPQYQIAVIPAATKSRNKARFKNLCALVAKKTGMQNGYYSIWREREIKEDYLRGSHDYNTPDKLGFDEMMRGSKVVLFDDEIITGTSFRNVAAHLKSKMRVNEVVGLFLTSRVLEEA